jgi:thyrotropin receptor
MEANDPYDVAYLLGILFLNTLGFVIIVACYAQIYYSLNDKDKQQVHAFNRETSIAKKMALLVNNILILGFDLIF